MWNEDPGVRITVENLIIFRTHCKEDPLILSSAFKMQLVDFVISGWSKDEFSIYFTKFLHYVTQKEKCYYYFALPDTITKLANHNFTSLHVEADSRIVYHLSKVKYSKVVVKRSDTYITILILGNQHLIIERTQV